MRWYVTSLAAGLAMMALACGASDRDARQLSALGDDAVTVASFDFPESVVLAEIYSQALEADGVRVLRAFALGPREFVGPALWSGLVEFVPEYAGTASEFVSIGAAEPTGDAASTHQELLQALGDGDVTALAAAPAEDANAFVVTAASAAERGFDELSDLGPVASELTFGGPPECASRPLCLAGLSDVYDLQFDEVVVLDTGGALTRQALRTGAVDVALLFTTDPSLAGGEFVELTDDRHLQPAENITPLVHTEIIDRWGSDLVDVVDGVSRRLTTEAVRDLNAALALPGAQISTIAAEWLATTGQA